MWQWIRDICQSILDGIWYIVDLFLDFIIYILDVLFNLCFSWLPASVQDGSALGLDLTTIETLHDNTTVALWDGILWLLPVSECILIVSAAYAISGVIRLVRWLLGFIPTLSLS
ncbi:MAG: hypothetical protein QF535_09735 [Anaerolineales bacterium]|nr:hypothetical protein [Anaerolineales bacterium]